MPGSLHQSLLQAALCICHKDSQSLGFLATLPVYSHDIQSQTAYLHHRASEYLALSLQQVLHGELIKQLDFP